jgi:type I restriction enzyme M protein
MRSGLGGHETLNLYAEAIAKMPENPGIPLLFRDIFKNAYLPYRDPETLKMFLKVIDEFTYDHSERLGDAFEYLLAVLGSQGEAGQFRTPRHIIDFMVEIIDPKKHETVLDPACGTAGFLISSYKHILKGNTDTKGNSTLTPDEKGRLAQNFKGYDISPDMVRLSLVNLYLHGFADPHIAEYDTLTSQDRWNEYADVILANPPFMSPKGGIKPHNRFSVQSKRSEVLFVDYMAEHLTPSGRAGIIVPEGIIFQSQTAYTQLRKMLVENSLVAVVSLPAGVFNPYSGVKTSILILDKSLARKTNTIAFFKVENDGFGLGAQRREIDKNDLPQAQDEIGKYLRLLRAGKSAEEFQPTRGLIVDKAKVAANGDYNLSGERYKENGTRSSKFPIVPLGDVAKVISGQSPPGESYNETGKGIPFYQGKTEFGNVFIGHPTKWTTDPQRFADEGDILISVRAPVGPVNLATQRICIGRGLAAIRPTACRLLTAYAFYVLRSQEDKITGDAGAAFASINRVDIEKIQIPLPPLEAQKEIVAEIEGYQKVINGARAVLDNYRPHIPIHPNWPMVELGEVCFFKRGPFGGSLKKEIFVKNGYAVYEQSHAITNDFSEFRYFVDEDKFAEMHGFQVRPGELIMSCSGTMGKVAIIPDNAPAGIINQALLKLTPRDCVLGVFLKIWMESTNFQESLADFTYGAAIKNVASVEILKGLRLPLPPLATQQAIVAEIEAEQALVAANRELIARFEKKIQATLARVWGEDKPVPAEA